MKRLFAAVLAAPFCVAAAQAQPSPPDIGGAILTLDRAIAEAGRRAASIDAAEAGVSSAEAGWRVAALRPNPSIAVDSENALGTGPYRGIGGSDTTVAFSMPVELGGKRSARIAAADAGIRRAHADRAIAAADLRLAVVEAYVAAIAAERRAVVAEAQLKVTAENLRIARDRVMVGANSPIDEQRAALEDVRAVAEADAARRAASAAWARLRRYVGDAGLGRLDDA